MSTPTVEGHAPDSPLTLGDVYFRKMIVGKDFGRPRVYELRQEAAQIDQHRSSIEVHYLRNGNLRGAKELSGLSDEGIGVLKAILTDQIKYTLQ